MATDPSLQEFIDQRADEYRERHSEFDQQFPAGQQEVESTENIADVDPTFGDYGRIVMSGGAQIGSGVGWLYKKMGFPGGEALQEAGSSAAQSWMEGLSPQAKAALQVEFTKRDRGQLWTDAKWNRAKLSAAQSLLGTAGGMGAGSVITKGLAKAGMRKTVTTAAGATAQVPTKTAGAIGYGLGEGLVAAPGAAAGVEDQIAQMSHEQLMASPEYRAAYAAMEGDEQARHKQAKDTLAAAAAGDTFALSLLSTFILSAPAGAFMSKVTAGMPLTEGGGRLAGAARGAGTEALQEFGQSGAEQMASNVGLRQADPNTGLFDDVLESAVGGALSGSIMGGVTGVAANPENAEQLDDADSPLNALAEDDDASVDALLQDMAEPDDTSIGDFDIDPVTGQIVPRTGDPERDALESQLADARLDLDMTMAQNALDYEIQQQGAQREQERQGSRNVQMIEMERQRDEQMAKQGRLAEARKQEEIEQAYRDRELQAIEPDEAAQSEALTPRGQQIEGEPVNMEGAQPADEGMLLPQGKNPAGGRPFNTQMEEALRGAGILPPDDSDGDGPAGGGGTPAARTPPERGPDMTPAEARASEALLSEGERIESDVEAQQEREAIQAAEAEPAPAPAEFDDIPFPEARPPVAEPPKPDVPKPTTAPNYARDSFLTTRAKSPTNERLSMDKFGAEGLDIEDMRTKIYAGKPAFSKNPNAMGPDDVAEFLNEKGYPNPYDDNNTGTWTANHALQAVDAEVRGMGQILTGEAMDTQQRLTEYEDQLGQYQRRQDEIANQPATLDEALAGDTAPAEPVAPVAELETDTDGQVDAFGGRGTLPGEPAEPAEVDPDIGVPGDLFSETANRQTDLEDVTGKPEAAPTTPASPEQIQDFEAKVKAAYRANELAGKAWQRGTKNQPQRESQRDAAAQEVLDMMDMVGVEQGRQILERLHAEHIQSKGTGWGMPDALARPFGFVDGPEGPADTKVGQTFKTNSYEGVDEFEVLAKNDDRKVALVRTVVDRTIDDDAGADVIGYMRYDSKAIDSFMGSLIEQGETPPERDTSQPFYTRDNYFTREEAIAEFEKRLTDADPDALEVTQEVEAESAPEKPENKVHVSSDGTVTLDIDNDQFNAVIDEYERLQETVPKSKRKAIDTKLKDEPYISKGEAKKRLIGWKRHARKQADAPTYRKDVSGYQKDDNAFNPEDNSQRVILSLFDYTGQWVQPYIDAGYDVYTFDIKTGQDILDFNYQYLVDEFDFFNGKEIYGILAACPCTTFSNSGTRWRKTRHDAKSKEMVEQMWGKDAVERGFEVPQEYGVALVEQTLAAIEYLQPKFWALENPEGRIEKSTPLNNWRTGFQPHNFGDPYTKRTLLWGNFNEDMPTANVEPTEGSKMHMLPESDERAALRSETPEGFAYAFFMANNYVDSNPSERLALEFPEVAGAVETAFEAGMTEPQIREVIETPYGNYEYIQARDALRTKLEKFAKRQAARAAVPTKAEIEEAANQAEPENATEAQKEAGNYKKGHLKIAGMDISIENPVGSVRYNNKKLKDHYGYIKGTKAADFEQLDVFINPETTSEWMGDVYVVDQYIDNVYDESKVMFGYNNQIDARRAYKRNFNDDWTGDKEVTKMSFEEFKSWLNSGKTTDPASAWEGTEAGRKHREEMNKKLRLSSGKDLFNAPDEKFIEMITKGGQDYMGDVVDTRPFNDIVDEMLRQQGIIKDLEAADAAAAEQQARAPVEAQVEQVVADMNENYPGANVVLVDFKDIPNEMREMIRAGVSGEMFYSIDGVTDITTGDIYLFRDRISSATDAKSLALHEMFHKGLRVAMPTDKMNNMLDDFYTRIPDKHRAKLAEIEKNYGLDGVSIEDRREAAEEVLAAIAETDPKNSALQQFVQAIREFLQNIGIIKPGETITDAEINSLIAEAKGALEQRQRIDPDATITEEVQVEETGEIFEIETNVKQAMNDVDRRIEVCRKVRSCL